MSFVLAVSLPAAAVETEPGVSEGAGLVLVPSQQDVEGTVARIRAAVEAGGATVVTVVDHAQAADEAGLELAPTTLLLVGNPQAGTPLMQAEQTIGIDLPQKLLVYEDADGEVNVAYNDPDYLAARHGIDGLDPLLANIGTTLQQLATGGATPGTVPEGEPGVSAGAGLVVVPSQQDVDGTVARIRAAVEAGGATVVTVVDHAQAADEAGLELAPTTLLLVGNPQAGTPLMQAEQTIGIDLPQKLLVYEDADGEVNVAYNDPDYLAARHGIDGLDPLLANIGTTLQQLSGVPVGGVDTGGGDTAGSTGPAPTTLAAGGIAAVLAAVVLFLVGRSTRRPSAGKPEA